MVRGARIPGTVVTLEPDIDVRGKVCAVARSGCSQQGGRRADRGAHVTVSEPLPCVDSPGEETSDAALERLAEERDRLSEHIADLIRTREALDGLMATARAHRERLRTALAG